MHLLLVLSGSLGRNPLQSPELSSEQPSLTVMTLTLPAASAALCSQLLFKAVGQHQDLPSTRPSAGAGNPLQALCWGSHSAHLVCFSSQRSLFFVA